MGKPDQQVFSTNANCYGYAVKCKNPTNVPPGMAIPGLVTRTSTMSDAQYWQALENGVLADGGNNVAKLTRTLSNVRAARTNYYLIAMLVLGAGFHFLRLQRSSPSGHPSGNGSTGTKGWSIVMCSMRRSTITSRSPTPI